MRPAATALAFLIIATTTSGAATILVPEDYPSILDAVDAAVSGDSVLVGPGTWTEADTRIVSLAGTPFNITSRAFPRGGVSIIGREGPNVTTLDVQGAGTGIVVANQTEDVLVEGFTLTGAMITGGGACVLAVGSAGVTVKRCRFVDNETDAGIVGINAFQCPVTVEESEFLRNRSTLGTVSVVEGVARLVACRFAENEGIAVHLEPNQSSGTNVIEECEFVDNKPEALAGSGNSGLVIEGGVFEVRRCVFLRNRSRQRGGAILSGGDGAVEFCTFAYDSTGGAGGAIGAGDGEVIIRSNTFVGCYAAAGEAAVWARRDGTTVTLERNIIAYSAGSAAIGAGPGSAILTSCNDFWSNEEGDFGNGSPDPTDFFLDPQFCDFESLDLTLHSTSPCAAKNGGACGQVGAWDVGCGVVAIRETTWGHIKSLYR